MASISISIFVDEEGNFDLDLEDGNGKLLATDLEGSVRMVHLEIEIAEPDSQRVDVIVPQGVDKPATVTVKS